MTRAEHLAWCKRRALEYVDRGDLEKALNSMLSDLGKWEGGEMYTPNAIAQLSMAGIMACTARRANEMRRWIEGFG
jgi:hypothetical protein